MDTPSTNCIAPDVSSSLSDCEVDTTATGQVETTIESVEADGYLDCCSHCESSDNKLTCCSAVTCGNTLCKECYSSAMLKDRFKVKSFFIKGLLYCLECTNYVDQWTKGGIFACYINKN
jgi:hypothetical protein